MYYDLVVDGCRLCGVIVVINMYGGIVVDGLNDFGEDVEGSYW